MFTGLVYTELLKYRRTIIPWVIGIGGFLTAGTALLLVSTENSQVSWEAFSATGFNCMNTLALLLVAVFTGYVFVGEYHEGTISILFTYPISKFKIYIVKYFVVLLLVISLYLTFFLSTMLFGLINIGDFPSNDLLVKFIKITLLMIVTNFVLVPVTALISNLVKGIGTYIFVGMSYFLIYISFMNSNYSLLIPTCIPNKLVANYFFLEFISKADFRNIILVCVVTFLLAFLIGAVYYSKSDVYE